MNEQEQDLYYHLWYAQHFSDVAKDNYYIPVGGDWRKLNDLEETAKPEKQLSIF